MVNWKKTMMSGATGGGGSHWAIKVSRSNSSAVVLSIGSPIQTDDSVYFPYRDSRISGASGYGLGVVKTDLDGNVDAKRYYFPLQSGGAMQLSGSNLWITNSQESTNNSKYSTPVMVVPADLGSSTIDEYGVSDGTNNLFGVAQGAHFDSSGDFVYLGREDYYTGTGFTNVWNINKLNSSGVVQGSVRYYFALNQVRDCIPSDLRVDSSDDYVVVGQVNAGTRRAHVLNLSNDLSTKNWAMSVWNTSGSDGQAYFYGVALDSSDNVYAVGNIINRKSGTDGYNQRCGIVVKFNSSGTLQWFRMLTDNASDTYIYGVGIDDEGYVSFNGNNGLGKALYGRFNTSGTLDFMNTVTISGLSNSGFDAFGSQVSDTGNQLLTVRSQNTSVGTFTDFYFLKLPTDGSLTGTYGDYTIAVDSSYSVYTESDSFYTIISVASDPQGLQNTGHTTEPRITFTTGTAPNSTSLQAIS